MTIPVVCHICGLADRNHACLACATPDVAAQPLATSLAPWRPLTRSEVRERDEVALEFEARCSKDGK